MVCSKLIMQVEISWDCEPCSYLSSSTTWSACSFQIPTAVGILTLQCATAVRILMWHCANVTLDFHPCSWGSDEIEMLQANLLSNLTPLQMTTYWSIEHTTLLVKHYPTRWWKGHCTASSLPYNSRSQAQLERWPVGESCTTGVGQWCSETSDSETVFQLGACQFITYPSSYSYYSVCNPSGTVMRRQPSRGLGLQIPRHSLACQTSSWVKSVWLAVLASDIKELNHWTDSGGGQYPRHYLPSVIQIRLVTPLSVIFSFECHLRYLHH